MVSRICWILVVWQVLFLQLYISVYSFKTFIVIVSHLTLLLLSFSFAFWWWFWLAVEWVGNDGSFVFISRMNSSDAGLTLVAECVPRYSIKNSSSRSLQFFLSETAVRVTLCIVLLNLSTVALPFGQYGVERLCLIPQCSRNCFFSSDTRFDPLSVLMSSGNPCLAKTLCRNLMMCSECVLYNTEYLSMTMTILSLESVVPVLCCLLSAGRLCNFWLCWWRTIRDRASIGFCLPGR